MGEQYVIRNEAELKYMAEHIRQKITAGPIQCDLKKWKEKRSLSSNSLYWVWLEKMAKHFSKEESMFTKDDIHDLMRHKFLGYTEERRIGRTIIPPQLKSTAKENSTEFFRYMQQIDAFSADHGCLLPRPEDDAYSQWYEQHENQKGCA